MPQSWDSLSYLIGIYCFKIKVLHCLPTPLHTHSPLPSPQSLWWLQWWWFTLWIRDRYLKVSAHISPLLPPSLPPLPSSVIFSLFLPLHILVPWLAFLSLFKVSVCGRQDLFPLHIKEKPKYKRMLNNYLPLSFSPLLLHPSLLLYSVPAGYKSPAL